MAQFDCTVDTSPMAESMNNVSGHVNATTAAVAAMQAAVIKSEIDSADHICKNIDKGFYSLIRSQISLKLASYYTQMTTRLALLIELSKSLGSTQRRMESDINRLKREYYKTFHGIDKALENRVYQLDKHSMQLALIRKNLITGRLLKDVPEVLCVGSDAKNTSLLAVSARLKSKTSRALSSIGKNINENQQYKGQLDRLLEDKTSYEEQKEYIPVIFAQEKSMVMQDASLTKLYVPDFLSKSSRESIESKIMSNIDAMPVTDPAGRAEVRKEFYNMAAGVQIDPRILQKMTFLFENGG